MAKIEHFSEWIQSKTVTLKAVSVGVSFPRLKYTFRIISEVKYCSLVIQKAFDRELGHG